MLGVVGARGGPVEKVLHTAEIALPVGNAFVGFAFQLRQRPTLVVQGQSLGLQHPGLVLGLALRGQALQQLVGLLVIAWVGVGRCLGPGLGKIGQ